MTQPPKCPQLTLCTAVWHSCLTVPVLQGITDIAVSPPGHCSPVIIANETTLRVQSVNTSSCLLALIQAGTAFPGNTLVSVHAVARPRRSVLAESDILAWTVL